MKILIIGGTRFIGKAIAEECLKSDHEVILCNRGRTKHSLDLRTIKVDIENILDIKDDLLKEDFDIVIHCIAYTEKHAEDIVNIFKNVRTKLIVLSSCDCYEVFQGLNRNIDKIEVPIDEDSQLSKMKYYWSDFSKKGDQRDKYDKNLMTDILMESFNRGEIHPIIFRLPMIYGPGDHQYDGRHGEFIKRILDGRRELILSDREQCQIYTYGYIGNITAAIIHSFDQNQCIGEIYNLGERYSRTRRKWADLYADYANWKFDIKIIPEELIREDKLYRYAQPQHKIMLAFKFNEHTGFKNPIDLYTAIKETFEYAKSNPDVLRKSHDYDNEDKLIEAYNRKLNEIYTELNFKKT